jgi:ribosomal protein S18 acetylase RimI-like enzyme
MIIRPIRALERDRFVSLLDAEQSELLREHLDDAFASGATTEAWCLVVEREDRWIGRAFLDGPAGQGQIFIHFFDVALEERDADHVAQGLIGGALAAVSDEDQRTVSFALDVEHPWHPEPARRRAWFEDAGFEVVRDGQRWAWPRAGEIPPPGGRLTFRALDEVGEDAFREAIARVSDGTLDARLREMRARLGRTGDAAEHFRMITGLRHEPNWLQLGFDNDGSLVGLCAAGAAVGVAFVAYVGVAPEMRGRGYVNDLVAHVTSLLVQAGEDVIQADTDVANKPMGEAFERAGYLPFMTRTDYAMPAERRRERLRAAPVR